MIAKLLKSGNNFYAAALYNQKKVNQKEAIILSIRGMPGKSPAQIQNYLGHISSFSSTKKPVLHLVLSFAKRDKAKLSNDKMTRISEDYLSQMGYGKQPYIIYRHDDTSHPHVHILTSRIDLHTGKKINDSYEQKRSKKIAEQLEKKYELTLASGQSKGLNSSPNPSQKALVQDLQKALKNAPTSLAQLNKSLQKNASPFRAKAVNRGLIYYRIGMSKISENQDSRSWKSSLLKAEGLDKKGLEQHFRSHQKDRKFIQNRVVEVLQDKPKMGQKLPLADFEKGLSKYAIYPKYAINEQGIFGLSYQYKDKVFKASELGKGQSWNQIQRNLEVPKDLHLRESLKESIASGEPIEVRYTDEKFEFMTHNKALEKALNHLPNEEATRLVQVHNQYQEQYHQAPNLNEKALLKDLAGHDIDEYLQRQYKKRLREQERKNQRKIR